MKKYLKYMIHSLKIFFIFTIISTALMFINHELKAEENNLCDKKILINLFETKIDQYSKKNMN